MKTAYGMSMFFGREDVASNWFISDTFVLKNVKFNLQPTLLEDSPVKIIPQVRCHCGEMAMMVLKAALFGDLEVYEELLETHDPKEIKALGRKVSPWDEDKWLRHREEIMLTVVLARARQLQEVRDWLLSTGDTLIVEASPYDKIWGAGIGEDDFRIQFISSWPGKNLLGRAYMTARAILRAELEAAGTITLSLNDRTSVRLTEYGAQVYRKHVEGMMLKPLHLGNKEIQKGQYYDFPLWDLMNIFGASQANHSLCFEDTEVRVTRA